jgi:hypothetical protein
MALPENCTASTWIIALLQHSWQLPKAPVSSHNAPFPSYKARREFITLVGPLPAMAADLVQRQVAVISAEPNASLLAAFRKGRAEASYTEGKNVAIEFRPAVGAIIPPVMHYGMKLLIVGQQS